ncbi:MAG: hypothetical protein JNL11_10225 [Bdellovibrionaceae bacterium]|nr:hypothetical protein [Pseudobdellovibrionaceae bacterium]
MKALFMLAVTMLLTSIAQSGAMVSPAQTIYHNSAIVVLKPGTYPMYIKAVKSAQIMSETLKEPGNVYYRLNVISQTLISFDEAWLNGKALQDHLATPHMTRFFKTIGFDPQLYTITQEGGSTVFRRKVRSSSNYAIEKLILNGYEFNQN